MKISHIITTDSETGKVVVETSIDGEIKEVMEADSCRMTHSRTMSYEKDAEGKIVDIRPSGPEEIHFIIIKE